MGVGVSVLAVGAIATGIVDLVWRRFDPAEQPIQAFGDRVAAHSVVFACVVALLLIVGGITIVQPRTARLGAVLLAVAYGVFAIFWSPRLVTGYEYLGWSGLTGALAGLGQEAIVIAALALVFVAGASRGSLQRVGLIARWIFGVSTIVFGIAHLANVAGIARMVPQWMPMGGNVWAVVTGIAFILAGIAIVSGILDVVAARLLTLMLAIFSVLALAPQLLSFTHEQSAWGANAYNIAAIGAVWVLADWLARRPRRSARAQ
ncbi:MAG: hypothetical protein JO146_04305 [Candidatus Eremiobacteraeota bacterium]|nr:hypothetical protein [Candidatus Eremiobacteraeota bacterium]